MNKFLQFGFLILAAIVVLSDAKAKFENCPQAIMDNYPEKDSCSKFTCMDDGKGISGVTCAPYMCAEGKEIGYKEEDATKVYPECCGGPICSDELADDEAKPADPKSE